MFSLDPKGQRGNFDEKKVKRQLSWGYIAHLETELALAKQQSNRLQLQLQLVQSRQADLPRKVNQMISGRSPVVDFEKAVLFQIKNIMRDYQDISAGRPGNSERQLMGASLPLSLYSRSQTSHRQPQTNSKAHVSKTQLPMSIEQLQGINAELRKNVGL